MVVLPQQTEGQVPAQEQRAWCARRVWPGVCTEEAGQPPPAVVLGDERAWWKLSSVKTSVGASGIAFQSLT